MHVLRREFQVRKLWYSYKNERVFYCCQWRWPRPVFVAIRVFLALYTIYGFIHMFVDHYARDSPQQAAVSGTQHVSEFKKPIMVFFTVWSYIMLTGHMVLAAVLCIVFYKRAEADMTKFKLRPVSIIEKRSDDNTELSDAKKQDLPSAEIQTFTGQTDKTYVPVSDNRQGKELTASAESDDAARNGSGKRVSSYESFRRYHTEQMSLSTPLYFKISWCLSDIVSAMAPIVTIIFFVALYPLKKNKPAAGLDIQDTNLHTLNLVFVVVDHLVSPRPVRLLHFAAPVIYGAAYVVFSAIYWATDHVNHVVYKNVLDWNTPGVAAGVTLGLALVAIPFMQLCFFLLYQLKCVIHRKLYACSFNGDLD
ncbi:hypothetical protein Btru_066536 [Bulinus truncatus]|nr:hypothetical protein Btru_066536 [Bulinus truncatus]